MGTSGAEGGPGKPASRKADRAPRPDPYTQHRTDQGWLYCAVVLDAYSRRVVGSSIADHLRTELVVDAQEMACLCRRPTAVMAAIARSSIATTAPRRIQLVVGTPRL